MNTEEYIASRRPLVVAVVIMSIHVLFALVTAVTDGVHTGIPYILLFGFIAAFSVPAAPAVKPKWLVMSFVLMCILEMPVAVDVLRVMFSRNADQVIAERPEWWLTTMSILTKVAFVPFVVIGIAGWRNYRQVHRREICPMDTADTETK